MRSPAPPSSKGALARDVVSLGRSVGGKEGRNLQRLALALSNGGGPDLSIRTKDMISAQAYSALRALGAYTPGGVSLAAMKQMRLDPQVQLALAATKAPMLDAPVFFQSSSREAVALCEAAWMESGVLRSLQRTSLQALEFGFAAHEKLWEVAENFEVRWPEPGAVIGSPEEQTKTYPHLFLPKQAKDLDPALVSLLQDEFGTFQGLLYGTAALTGNDNALDLVKSKKVNALMPEKAFLFSVNSEWGNLYGRGRLVSAYDPWYWKRIIYLVCNRWYERKSDPPYVGFAPSDPTLMDPGQDDTDYDPADARRSPILNLRHLIANGLRSSGVIVLPSEPYKDDNNKPSAIRAYDMKELGITDVHPAFMDYIAHLNAMISRGLLVPDGAISTGENSGTYGSTQALSEVAIKIQNETNVSWIQHFNRYYLKQFCEVNGIKDRVTLRTTGISSDNRDVLLAILEKMSEGDMLLDQAWGPQFPDSIGRLVDRRGLLRALNIPFDIPNPNAPPPKMPKPPPAPAPAAGAAKGKASSAGKTGGKKATGLSRSEGRRLLDIASTGFQAHAQQVANAAEAAAQKAGEAAPYQDEIDAHEKAIAAVMLWYLLRVSKTDKAGKRVKGQSASVDGLVLTEGGSAFLDVPGLADAYPELERLSRNLEGTGYRVDPASNPSLLAKAQGGVEAILENLPSEVEAAMPPEDYLRPALDEAEAAFSGIVTRFDPQKGVVVALTEDEEGEIVALNSKGLLWNVENISIREGRSLVEEIVNGSGNRRLLGLVSDVATTTFNQRYSDLSIEAHYRATFRGAMLALAKKNGYDFMLCLSAAAGYLSDNPYAGEVHSIDEWEQIATRMKQPAALAQFGFHPGSLSFWLPVPSAERERGGVKMMARYYEAKAALAAAKKARKTRP